MNYACLPLGKSAPVILVVVYLFIALISVCCLVSANMSVIHKLIESQKVSGSKKSQSQPVVRLSAITITYVASATAVSAVIICSLLGFQPSHPIYAAISFLLLPLPACVNPWIYALSTDKFTRYINVKPLVNRVTGFLMFVLRWVINHLRRNYGLQTGRGWDSRMWGSATERAAAKKRTIQ